MTDQPLERREPAVPPEPAEPADSRAGRRDPDLISAWRGVGDALTRLGGGIGESIRAAWESSAPHQPGEAPAQGLRRLADAFDRGVESARRAATSPEARELVNAEARRAGTQLDRAVRLSIAEVGRTLQRVAPDEHRAEPVTREGPGPVATEEARESPVTDDPADRA